MSARKPLVAAVSGAAVVLAALVVPLSSEPAGAATVAARTATLVGSLQSELGCAGDWDPTCAKTDLAQVGGSTVYQKVFDLPAGTFELKVAVNHSWDENYGAGGVNNGPN
ncbi:MAG TPA: hypothetical protein VGK60_02190, partial [Pedococcus sp.]